MPDQPSDARAAREARWRRIWQSRRWPAWGWWPLAQLHGALLRLRRLAYRANILPSTRVACPVLVVGNVVVGGAGKTPTTIALVQHLSARGLRVGVISRGHGRDDGGAPFLAVSAQSSAQQVGDEPLLIQRRTGVPVYVARQRAHAAQALLQAHPDTQLLICDDGLQHLALARDISLCVFDERGLGNGWLLPAGPLREPWPVAVDVCLQIGNADEQEPTQRMAGAFKAVRQLAAHAVDGQGQRMPLAALRTRRVLAFAGIAKPEVFFAALRAAGLTPEREISLGDHASAEGHAQLRALLHGEQASTPLLLCTEKDAVKLWPRFPQVLAVPLQLTLPADLLATVDARVNALTKPSPNQDKDKGTR